MEYTCQHCGQTFEADKSAKRKYCSHECYLEHSFETGRMRPHRTFTCKNCGKEFTDKARDRTFCSRSCHMTWQHANVGERKRKVAAHNRTQSPNPGRDVLVDLYEVQELSAAEIGEMFDVQGQTVRKWLHQTGIEVVPRVRSDFEPERIEPPPEDELRELYEQGMTGNQIGKHYGVSNGLVFNWMDAYGIERRPAGVGLDARGIEPPTKEQLHDMIHNKRMSYREVAEIYGVDQSAVPYWLDNLGVERPKTWHEILSEPDNLTELRQKYEAGASLRDLAKDVGVTKIVIHRLFKEYGIPLRRDGWQGGRRYKAKDGTLVRSTYERRVTNWLVDHGIPYEYEPTLPFAPTYKADFKAGGWYIEVWGVANNGAYDERKVLKQSMYEENDAPLINLPRSVFRGGKWKQILQNHLLSSVSE